jgi:Domain of unknown function (DUF4062)
VNVFISSVIVGMGDQRNAAKEAIELLGHQVVQAEQMAASPSAPQRACLQAAREADVVVLLMGGSYGGIQPSGRSATHEEYLAVSKSDKVLAFVQTDVDREPRQQGFLTEVREWEKGHFTRDFRTARDLEAQVARALRAFEVERATGVVDETQLVSRADTELHSQLSGTNNYLILVITPGPPASLLRPSELRADRLGREIAQEMLFGESPVFELSGVENPVVKQDRLVVAHKSGSVTLDCAGTIVVKQPAEPAKTRILRPLVEEDIQEKLHRALSLVGRLLNRIDPSQRATAVVPVATITNPTSWVTQAEFEANPDHLVLKRLLDFKPVSVHLTPAAQRRPSLLADTQHLAEDLTVLLRTKIG